MREDRPTVIIVGAGVIGCACAYELAKAGCRVQVVERGELGREASWASAGMVAQAMPASDPLSEFHAAGSRLFPELAAEISDLTSVDASYRRNGGFRLYTDPESWPGWVSKYEERQRNGLHCDILTPAQVVEFEPELSISAMAGGVYLPHDGVVDPRQYTRVLALASAKLGAEFHFNRAVTGFERDGDRILGVQTPQGPLFGDVTVLAAGSWSQQIGDLLGISIPMQPAKGQIIQLQATPPVLRHTVHCNDFYITARSDGTMLLGSTVEFVGFDTRVTPMGVKHLMDQALRVAPALGDATVVDQWAGLRPYPERELPYLGFAPGVEGVFVAAGHFRTGISPSPITGKLVAEAVTGQPTTLPLEPFALSTSEDETH